MVKAREVSVSDTTPHEEGSRKGRNDAADDKEPFPLPLTIIPRHGRALPKASPMGKPSQNTQENAMQGASVNDGPRTQ